MRLCQFNFVQIFLLNPNFLLVQSCWIWVFFSYIGIGIWRGWTTDRKVHVDTLIFIPTWKFSVFSFSRQINNFCVLWRNISISYVIPQKVSLWNFLVNTLLLYIPLLTLIDRQNHRWRNTLATHGLEEPFFQLSCCVSIWFWWEIGFGFTYYIYLCTQSTIQLWCCVSFLSGGK